MDRRQILRWGGASLISFSASPWLAGCAKRASLSALPPDVDQDPQQVLELDFAGCLARARSLGKPVLVFVAPSKAGPEPYEVTGWFADFLSSGQDELWRDLALCELSCASLAEIREALPAARLKGSPRLILIEHDPSGSHVASSIDQLVADRTNEELSEEDWLREQMDRFAPWSLGIHQAVAANPADLARRADDARRALGPVACARVEEALGSASEPSRQLLSSAAALFLDAAEERPGAHGRFRALVIDSVRQSALERGFSGAGWGKSFGCGVYEESPRKTKHPIEEIGVMLCGIGFIDEHAGKFLWFYTDENR